MPKDAWVVILDADVLLPINFRQRLDRYDLYPRALYGLYARRGCETWEEYEWRRDLEPWSQDLGWHPNILGYFQMFRLDQPHNRYPLKKTMPEMHDDIAFQYLFKPQLRRLLPMTCLHVGPPQVNWGGRASVDFRQGGNGKSGRNGRSQAAAAPEALSRLPWCETLVVIGMDPTTPIRAYAAQAKKTIVIDWHGLRQSGLAQIMDRDAKVQLALWEQACHGAANVTEHTDLSEGALAALLKTTKPDCLLFDIELRVEVLGQWARLLRATLEADCRVVGRFYGFPKWKETTLAINLLLGPPEQVCRDGSWSVALAATEFRKPRLQQVLPRLAAEKRSQTTVWLLLREEEEMELLTRWLFGPLADWPGKIGVIDAAHAPVLQIMKELCDLQVESTAPRLCGDPRETLTAHALTITENRSAGKVVVIDVQTATPEDFQKGTAWNEGGVLMAVSARWSQATAKTRREVAQDLEKISGKKSVATALAGLPSEWRMFACAGGSVELREWSRHAALAAEARLSNPVRAALAAILGNDGGRWNFQDVEAEAPGWDLAPEDAQRIGGLLAPVVRPPERAVIIVAVPEAAAELFMACVATWRFSSPIPIVAVASPKVAAALRPVVPGLRWLVAETGSQQVSAHGQSLKPEQEREALERLALTSMASGSRDWDHVIVLKSNLHPAPGAGLFGGEFHQRADLELEIKNPETRRSKGKTDRNAGIVESAPVVISQRVLEEFAQSGGFGLASRGWRPQLFAFAQANDHAVKTRHPFALGWLAAG